MFVNCSGGGDFLLNHRSTVYEGKILVEEKTERTG